MGSDLYTEGISRLNAGDSEEAVRLLEEARRQGPASVELLLGLARALDAAGARERSVAALKEALALQPDAPVPACELAMYYLEHEQDAQAVAVLEPALAAAPEDAQINLCMAMAQAKKAPERARGFAARALKSSDPEVREQAQALDKALAANAPR